MGKPFSSNSNVARFAALFFVTLLSFTQPSLAADPDLPLASQSPLSGVGFDDKPLFLPVQKNFQMAMLTAGSELGRSCGKMEAYGWRLASSEQSRVDQIFNTTVDRFRGMGYVVEMQSPNSVSHDITMFTADHDKKHFLTMWSAGDIGLVMVLCETGVSRSPRSASSSQTLTTPSVQTFSQPATAPAMTMPANLNATKQSYDKFSPVGYWVGSYICGQGYTGGTLTISQLRGENFEGMFHFYPTAKNPTVPEGRYTVYGQYDKASQRILINPGQWVTRPPNYYNTIIVGSFDPITETLSAYFQGINGCTSFEAKLSHEAGREKVVMKHHKHAKPKPKAKPKVVTQTAKPVEAPVAEAPALTTPEAASTPAAATQETPVVSAPAAVPAPTPSVAPAPAPAVAPPAADTKPMPLTPTATPAAPAPTPAAAPAAKSEAVPSAPAPAAATATPERGPPLLVGAPTGGAVTTGTAAPATK